MSIVKYNPANRSEATAVATHSFESATAEVVNRHFALRERAVLYVLTGMLLTIFLFICIVHLDRVVSAEGRIVPTGGAVTVQPLEKAIINRILVSVGDVVKKDQVLFKVVPTLYKAKLDAELAEYQHHGDDENHIAHQRGEQGLQGQIRLMLIQLQ